MQAVSIIVNGDAPVAVAAATPVGDLLPSVDSNGLPVIGAIVNNMVQPLYAPLLSDSRLKPISIASKYGWQIYRDSLCFFLAKIIHEQFPAIKWRIRSSIGPALFCSVESSDQGFVWNKGFLSSIEKALKEIIDQDVVIVSESFSYEDAVNRLKKNEQGDKLNLILHRNPPYVALTRCGAFYELSKKPLVRQSGALKLFDLIFHKEGFVLNVPDEKNPSVLSELAQHEYLLDVCREHMRWGEILGVTTVGQLNKAIIDKRGDELILTAEALHDKKISQIADKIATLDTPARLVLVAGPSSAGKTTFAKRLVTHLRVNGLRPTLISTDNYFVGDALNPRDANGDLDYEHINSMDLPRLNNDLVSLMAGTPVKMRGFDFINRCGFDQKECTQLDVNGVIVMEGIHCLNPQLTSDIPKDDKFLIYVNALTQISVDINNRISTNDARVIRRIVRDHQFRNRSAMHTLDMWSSVMRGEHRWIYPYQHLADAVFNSALDYELAVLQSRATALLNQVKPWDDAYIEARRLQEFLFNFTSLSPDTVPGDSILREYIGGSQLKYG
ncbi:MAG: nucleoside kinase [Kiritimatiellae bacterium]|jgi:uridine kinase|nr:nucleoside kinase [Kiritimatiellia bacterium]